MSLYTDLQHIEQLSRDWLSYVAEKEDEKDLISRLNASSKLPPGLFSYKGVMFTSEGAKTPLSGTEPVEIDLTLPSQTVAWNLKPGKYEVRIRLSRPGSVTARSGEDLMMKDRQVAERAVLTFTRGKLRLTATSMIQHVSIRRYESRQEGEVVIGPIPAGPGFISAEAVGEGNWEVDVASNYWVQGQVKADYAPYFDGDVDRTYKARLSETDQQPEPAHNLTWTTFSGAYRLAPVKDLSFYSEIPVGQIFSNHQQVDKKPSQRTDVDHDVWWDRIGEWTFLSGAQAPGFYTLGGKWAVVWGKVEGDPLFAVDLSTGGKSAASVEGHYLVCVVSEDDVTVKGVYGAGFNPMHSRGTAKGSYAHADKQTFPREVYIRARGTGHIRKLKLKTRARYGPAGKEEATTRRIDLAGVFTDKEEKDSPAHNIQTDGEILFPQ